jgi:hypothetical protein
MSDHLEAAAGGLGRDAYTLSWFLKQCVAKLMLSSADRTRP